MAMTATQINTYVKNEVAKQLNITEIGTQIDDFVWAIPVTVENEDGETVTRYAKVTIAAALAKATKTNPAFDLGVAVRAYDIKKNERAEKAAEKAAKAKK